jgi:hypothetical protein
MLLKHSGLVKLRRVILPIGLSFLVFCISACFDLLGGNGGDSNTNGLTDVPDDTGSPADGGETDGSGLPGGDDTDEGITIQFFAWSDEWGERWGVDPRITLLPYLPNGSKITRGRTYTITIQGISDREMNNLGWNLLDDSEGYKDIGPWVGGRYIPKGNFSLTLSLSAYSSAADTSEKANVLHVENWIPFPAGYEYGDLIATLSNVKISIEVDDPSSGTVKLRGNTNSGTWESMALPSTVPVLKKNTSYKFTMTGTSDREMNHFFMQSYNEGTELVRDGYGGPQGHIPAGDFTLVQYTNTMNIDAVTETYENFYFLLTEKPDSVPVEADSKVMATLSNVWFNMEEQPKRIVTLYAYENGWHSTDIFINTYLSGELKKNTSYSVTISGNNDTAMNHFHISFRNEGVWVDISDWIADWPLPAGPFSLTKTITTNSHDAILNHQDYNVLFLYNDLYAAIPASDEGKVMATLTIDSISITELP